MNNIEKISNSLDQFYKKGKETEFSVGMIPLFLYEEMSHYITQGDESVINIKDNTYHVRELNPDHKLTGFEGAIGVRKSNEIVYFVLWGRVPKGTDGVLEPDPILEINAGSRETGVWCYGSGNRIEENIMAKFPNFGFSLENQTEVNFISRVLSRASELANNPKCFKSSYWENYMPPLRPGL